jgi:NAD(P)-dependent dehydrogenase (short-subunit alcohol dehydrogenase family)
MTQNLAVRKILITGGTGATGFAAARELHRLGATVVIGTRRTDRYEAAEQALGGGRVAPFVADLTDRDAVRRALDRLRADGHLITDVVHSAAGGLEPVIRLLMRRLMSLKRLSRPELAAGLEDYRAFIAGPVEESRPFARRVNLEGPSVLFDELAPRLPAGGTMIYYTSLWSSLYGQVPPPDFYVGVAESKHAFEEWMGERSAAWTARGLSPTVVSGHIILDSSLGELIDRHIVPLMPAERQAVARSFFISTGDMVRCTVRLIRCAPPAAPGQAARVFLDAPGRETTELDPGSPALADPLPT